MSETLPQLPAPHRTLHGFDGEITPLFSTAQMHAYGRSCVAAERNAMHNAILNALSDLLSRDEHDQPLDGAYNHALDDAIEAVLALRTHK